MKMICAFILAAATLSTSAQAITAPYAIRSGDELGQACADPAGKTISAAERERLLVCGAYIRGYLGYYAAARGPDRHPDFCLPAQGITAEALRATYIAVLRAQPQLGSYPAALDLTSILKAGYPCAAR